jgi:hypothetical protein
VVEGLTLDIRKGIAYIPSLSRGLLFLVKLLLPLALIQATVEHKNKLIVFLLKRKSLKKTSDNSPFRKPLIKRKLLIINVKFYVK